MYVERSSKFKLEKKIKMWKFTPYNSLAKSQWGETVQVSRVL